MFLAYVVSGEEKKTAVPVVSLKSCPSHVRRMRMKKEYEEEEKEEEGV
jgi:hypothetical protein